MKILLHLVLITISINALAQREGQTHINLSHQNFNLNKKEVIISPSNNLNSLNEDIAAIKPKFDSISTAKEEAEVYQPVNLTSEINIPTSIDDENVVAIKEMPIEQQNNSKENYKNIKLTPAQNTPPSQINLNSETMRPKIIFIKERLILLEKEIIENKENPNYDIKAAEAELEDLRLALKVL